MRFNGLLKRFIKYLDKKNLKDKLLFIILYGSRVEDGAKRDSDYDLIVVFEDKQQLNDFKKLNVVYSLSIEQLKDVIKTSISMYSVLTDKNAYKVVNGEENFESFKKEFLDVHKPDFKTYKLFMLRKSKREGLINGLKERRGRKATVWAYHSIRSLLQLKKKNITRDMNKLIDPNSKLLENLVKKFKDREGLSDEEKEELINFMERTFKELRSSK